MLKNKKFLELGWSIVKKSIVPILAVTLGADAVGDLIKDVNAYGSNNFDPMNPVFHLASYLFLSDMAKTRINELVHFVKTGEEAPTPEHFWNKPITLKFGK